MCQSEIIRSPAPLNFRISGANLGAGKNVGGHDLIYNVYIDVYTVCTKVNGMNVESCCHDDAVTILKNAGDNVQLTLKYFEPASGFLSLKGMLHLASKTSHGVTITWGSYPQYFEARAQIHRRS